MKTKPILITLTLISLLFGALPIQPVSAEGLSANNGGLLGAIQQSKLSSLNPAAADKFGWTVAISGDTLVVGSPNEDLYWGSDYLSNAGAAYVFIRQGTEWVSQGKLTAKDPKEYENFGASVAIDGSTILVGAPGTEVDKKENVGAAYVFNRISYTWKITKKLIPTEPQEGEDFGIAVALDGRFAVIGADGRDLLPFFLDAGMAYVFSNDNGTWNQKNELVAGDAKVGGTFGAAVDIDGSTLVVGATEANPYGDSGPGSAYVFTKQPGGWAQEAKLDRVEDRNGDLFGYSVAISGEKVVVGAPSADPDLGGGRITNGGGAFVYNRNGGAWDKYSSLVPDDTAVFDSFGRSVDIHGNLLIVGADGRNYYDEFRAGNATLFRLDNKEWVRQTTLVSDYPVEDGGYGRDVALSTYNILVGASGGSAGAAYRSGQAFVYALTSPQLPATGFAPDQVTFTKDDLVQNAYEAMSDFVLAIPALGVEMDIVSVPQEGMSWNVTWLWDEAGYLEGTGFPTWDGNTGIAAHVTLPNGNPGPFRNLHSLERGDQIVIYAWGETHLYEVREVMQVSPEDLGVLGHEEHDWLTLITCEGFDDALGAYQYRVVVRAERVQ